MRAGFVAVLLTAVSYPALCQTFPAPAISQGPAPITDTTNNNAGVNLPSGNSAGGAVTSIVTDPGNPATIWLGTANGGVWRSTNAGLSFQPLTDRQSSLSIGALTLNPTSPANTRTLVAGFGNFSNASNSGGALNGLLISTNGGINWSPLGQTDLTGYNIGGVVANGQYILAASPDAAGALFRSDNAGVSFTSVPGFGGAVTGLVADPSKPGRLYAAIVPANAAQAKVLMSPDNGATWTTVFSATQAGNIIGTQTPVIGATTTLRINVGPTGALAIGVVNKTTLPDGAQPQGLFLSTNPASTAFTSLSLPLATTKDGLVFGLNPGGQALLNFALAIDPNNPNVVYVSGDRQALTKAGETQDPGNTPGQQPNTVGATTYTATVFKVVLQPDGSSLYQAITDNFTGNKTAPHADTRAIAFNAASQLLLASDGGLYARSQPSSATGDWNSLNGGLSAIESYKAAYDPISRRIVAAAQDNGAFGQVAPGGLIYSDLAGGDGFNAAVDAKTLAAQGQSILYVGTNSLALQRLVTNAAGQSVRGDVLAPMAVTPAGAVALKDYENPNPKVAAPDLPLGAQFALNRVDPSRVAVGSLRVYVGQLDPAAFTGSPPSVPMLLTDLSGRNLGNVSALAYGAADNPGALIAGIGSTVFVSTATTPAPGTLVASPAGPLGGAINTLVFDPDRFQHFFATTGTTVMETVNSGKTFANLSGNLPTTFQNVNAAEFISNNGVRALFAGGTNAVANAQSPVYVALDGTLATWSAFGTGLPNALVNQLTYTPQSDLLLVSTLGRGVFTVNDVTSYFSTALALQFGFAGNDSTPVASQVTDGVNTGNAFSRGLVKRGAGTLTLAVPASYSGTTGITAGTLRTTAPNVLVATSDHTIAPGALLDLNSFNQTIGSLAGGGQVNLGAATLTTGGSNASTSFAGAIAGSGGVTKAGTGTFTLAGTSSYTGATTVSLGTLAITAGSVLASNVSVTSGATLATVPGQPGAPPIQLAALTTQPGSMLRINPTQGNRPAIAATGAVSLSGTVIVQPTPDQEIDKAVLPLITGSVVTDNRAMVSAIGPLRAVADPVPGGFSVMLVSGETSLAQGPVQTAVATVLDSGAQATLRLPLQLALLTDDVIGQQNDLRALSGVGLTGYETAAVVAAQRFQDAIAGHIADAGTAAALARQMALSAGATRLASAAGALDPALLLAASTALTPEPNASGRVWLQAAGGFSNLSGHADAPSVRTTGGGVVFGVEKVLNAGALVGLAAGYDSTAVATSQLNGASRVDGYRIAAYARMSLGERLPWLGGSLAYSRSRATGGRTLALGLDGPFPTGGSVSDKIDGNTFAGQLQLGQRFTVAGFDLVPTAAIQALRYEQGSFTETGTTGAELAVGGRTRTSLRSVLGAIVSRAVNLTDGMVLSPAASLGWAHEFADRGSVLNAAFATGGNSFRIDGAVPGRDAALLGLSATLQANTKLAIYLAYNAALAQRSTGQGITGGIRYTW